MKRKAHQNQKIKYLFIEVFQRSSLQYTKKLNIDSFFSQMIRMGRKKSCEISVPFAKLIESISLFKIGRGKVEVLVDGGLEGFINTPHQFADIREFVSPDNGTSRCVSRDKPLVISLNFGARGKICVGGYEIVFKIDHDKPTHTPLNMKGVAREFFQLPTFDEPIERSVIPISLLGATLIFLPILIWLAKAPSNTDTGLLRMPNETLVNFIAPENLRLIPHIYGDSFKAENTVPLSLLWLLELNKRWTCAEQGKSCTSHIPFLEQSKAQLPPLVTIDEFKEKVKNNYENFVKNSNNKTDSRYFSFLKKSPEIQVQIAGNALGSNHLMVNRRLEQLKLVDAAIIEYLQQEHLIIKNFYAKKHEAKKIGIVEGPQTGQVLGPQPSPLFQTQLQNFQAAEYFANLAENSKLRIGLQKADKNTESNSTVYISPNELVFSRSNWEEEESQSNLAQLFENLHYNAMYSIGVYTVPPLPKPKPTVPLELVHFVLHNKNNEIQNCYNLALRKNPNLQGFMHIAWKINAQGKALGIHILKNSINDERLKKCMESRLSEWTFPKTKIGEAEVQFSLQFKKKNDEQQKY